MSCSPLNQFGLLRCIETPLVLLQVEVEVGSRDAVETAHMTLGLISEILDAVDMVLVIGERSEWLMRAHHQTILSLLHRKSSYLGQPLKHLSLRERETRSGSVPHLQGAQS